MAQKFDYQTLNNELETILSELESGTLPVDDAIKRYERGMDITKELQAYLKTVENQVKRVKNSSS
jgi:exodeoxyribonuclease VII small subunit